MAAVLGFASPAAAAYPQTGFDVYGCCVDYITAGNTDGVITWYNRTAYISGDVYTGDSTTATAVFEAFASDATSSKIESQTRTVSGTWNSKHFGFTIGDSNLVGGIHRIKITLCDYSVDSCGRSINYYNPS
ncbi:hypothetical protein ABZ783_37250 [Micromonospora sp. NPDC047738]|uniref:hypothetical protein n=1 Tax=Micromonospora sp. NPDC047738 TaxID=3155741 RepID=UPI0033D34E30